MKITMPTALAYIEVATLYNWCEKCHGAHGCSATSHTKNARECQTKMSELVFGELEVTTIFLLKRNFIFVFFQLISGSVHNLV